MTLAAILNLVKRHPQFPGNVAGMTLADGLLDGIRNCFDWSPACVEVVRRGDDPAHDVRLPRPAADGIVLPHF